MNNLSNLEMQSFLFLMQNAQCNLLRKEKEENTRMLFVIFPLKFFQDENKTKSYANIFFFFKYKAKQCNRKKET
jgi:hypothetical protein